MILRCLWGLEAYIYKMFMSSGDQCIYCFRATGGPSNLVLYDLTLDNMGKSNQSH